MNFSTTCPNGHTIEFSHGGLERLGAQTMTLGVQCPDIYEKKKKEYITDATVFCSECNKEYALTECKKP